MYGGKAYPFIFNSDKLLGISISFIDGSRTRELQMELEKTRQDLEMAYEEVQSSNEELETMNEELQSSNEELQATNKQLRHSSEEIDQANAYLSSILSSFQSAVVVLDSGLTIRIWNRKAEDLWGLRDDEVSGVPLFNLDIGLPVMTLKPHIHRCLEGKRHEHGVILDAINRRGKNIQCRVTCDPLKDPRDGIAGVILTGVE